MAMLLTMVLSIYLFSVKATIQVLYFGCIVVLLHWGSCSSLFVLTCFNPLFAALLGHYHLYNFPADVFYACAHAC